MAAPKKKRIAIRIDMTPMVDVAFLLLTFFMLTTQFRPQEEVQIEVPLSHSEIKLPESNVITVTIAKDGKILLAVDSQHLMGKLFGEENKLKRSVFVEKKEELGNLLIKARMSNPKLVTVIKGDRGAPYSTVEDVMNILQKVKINKFNLVTDIEVERKS
jgi:biopolymer transport protein ExbD